MNRIYDYFFAITLIVCCGTRTYGMPVELREADSSGDLQQELMLQKLAPLVEELRNQDLLEDIAAAFAEVDPSQDEAGHLGILRQVPILFDKKDVAGIRGLGHVLTDFIFKISELPDDGDDVQNCSAELGKFAPIQGNFEEEE